MNWYGLILMGLTACAPAFASPFTAPARELAERIIQAGGRNGVQELAELGGREAVEELLEQSMREGGETLVRRVGHYGSRHGALALRTIRHAPASTVRALDELPENLVRPALGAIRREPERLVPLLDEFGSRALRAELKHPGLAANLVTRFGDDGLRLADRLDSTQLISLNRHFDDIADMAAPQQSTLLNALAKAPSAVIRTLNDNPKVLMTAGGVASIAVLADKALEPSKTVTTKPDGTIIEQTTSAFDTASERFEEPAGRSIAYMGIAIAGGITLWFALHLLPLFIRQLRKIRA